MKLQIGFIDSTTSACGTCVQVLFCASALELVVHIGICLIVLARTG